MTVAVNKFTSNVNQQIIAAAPLDVVTKTPSSLEFKSTQDFLKSVNKILQDNGYKGPAAQNYPQLLGIVQTTEKKHPAFFNKIAPFLINVGSAMDLNFGSKAIQKALKPSDKKHTESHQEIRRELSAQFTAAKDGQNNQAASPISPSSLVTPSTKPVVSINEGSSKPGVKSNDVKANAVAQKNSSSMPNLVLEEDFSQRRAEFLGDAKLKKLFPSGMATIEKLSAVYESNFEWLKPFLNKKGEISQEAFAEINFLVNAVGGEAKGFREVVSKEIKRIDQNQDGYITGAEAAASKTLTGIGKHMLSIDANKKLPIKEFINLLGKEELKVRQISDVGTAISDIDASTQMAVFSKNWVETRKKVVDALTKDYGPSQAGGLNFEQVSRGFAGVLSEAQIRNLLNPQGRISYEAAADLIQIRLIVAAQGDKGMGQLKYDLLLRAVQAATNGNPNGDISAKQAEQLPVFAALGKHFSTLQPPRPLNVSELIDWLTPKPSPGRVLAG